MNRNKRQDPRDREENQELILMEKNNQARSPLMVIILGRKITIEYRKSKLGHA